MGETLIGVGILLAAFGPLLLVPVFWVVYRFLAKKIINKIFQDRFRQMIKNLIAFAASVAVVLVVLFISYLPGKMKYNTYCAEYGTPSIKSHVNTENFYRTRLYPYEAKQFLGPEGFTFVEAPHMYKPGRFVKYTMSPAGNVQDEEIPIPTSQYGIRDKITSHLIGITLSQKIAYEMESGKTFAQASSIFYNGGPLSLFMGVYGMKSCPDILTEAGSSNFNTYYNFEKEVLLSDKLMTR